MPTLRLALLALVAAPAGLAAQKSELDPTVYGVVYDLPASRQVVLRSDIPFAHVGTRDLRLDLYAPPGKSGPRPAVVFINAVGDTPQDPVRRWAIYTSWPRLVAAHGLVGIAMDAERDRIQESLRGLFTFLRDKGRTLGVDPDRIGVYAASANVSGAHEYLLSDSVIPGIRAAAYFYGGVPQGRKRKDLPVLFIQAQGDASRMAPVLGPLWQEVVDSALPWTLVFGRGMPHAFDALTDSDDARHLIQQTLAFWDTYLVPMPPQPAIGSEGRRIVESMFANDPRRSVELLGPWLARHPNNGEAFMHYGRLLSELRRFDEAESAYVRAYQLDSSNPGTLTGLGTIRIGQQRWRDAETLLLRAVDLGFESSLIHGQLGWARLHTGQNAEAAASYERAIALGIPPGPRTSGLAWYNLACAYARLRRVDDAFRALNRAVDEGLRERRTYEADEDLARLRGDARFSALLERLPA